MITKYPDFWHLYYHETCEDNPAAILALVESLFKEIAEMGDDLWYPRTGPIIERFRNFGDDDARMALVHCRFSSKPRIEREIPALLGLPRE